MHEDYEKLFGSLPSPELPERLFEKIIHRITLTRKRRTLQRKIVIFSVIFVFSATAFIPAFLIAQTRLIESGFIEFALLIFLDAHVATAYWQSWTLALVESLPAMPIAFVLLALLWFLQSFRSLTHAIHTFLISQQITHN